MAAAPTVSLEAGRILWADRRFWTSTSDLLLLEERLRDPFHRALLTPPAFS
jgi:hypothetical protein